MRKIMLVVLSAFSVSMSYATKGASSSRNKVELFYCAKCAKGFEYKRDLKKHDYAHKRVLARNVLAAKESFVCFVINCKAQYKQRECLDEHQRKMHASLLGIQETSEQLEVPKPAQVVPFDPVEYYLDLSGYED